MTPSPPPYPSLPCSFRDPAGYVFSSQGTIKRVVTHLGEEDYRHYCASGLRDRLAEQKLVVDHVTEEVLEPACGDIHAILVPRRVPFISYPHEWSFDQLKDAALLTLQVQEEALACGMSLKDASAYNVQFFGAAPVFIDLSSFEVAAGGPWVAYEQFCRHFLGPLLLMHYADSSANRFFRADLDGLALDTISRLLPWRSWLSPDVLINIHLHSRSQQNTSAGALHFAARSPGPGLKRSLISTLRAAIEGTKGPPARGVWADYATNRTHYSEAALDQKRAVVREILQSLRPELVYDLGANDGIYSKEATLCGAYCVAFDADAGCVNRHYLARKRAHDRSVLPLVMQLENPSPGMGFHLAERSSLLDRGKADCALVLAVLHHLRITARAPFSRIASFLASLARSALLEFVPLSDPMAQRLLRGRERGMDDYSLDGFLAAFGEHFSVSHRADLAGGSRSLWLAQPKALGGAA